LNIAFDQPLKSASLAWDIVDIQEGWLTQVRDLELGDMIVPTEVRGRTICDLLVNTFRTLELVAESYTTGTFQWGVAEDVIEEQAAIRRLEQSSEMSTVFSYAVESAMRWTDFAFQRYSGEGDPSDEPVIVHPVKGDIPFGALLLSQRWHSAFHLAQVLKHCELVGLPHPEHSVLDGLTDLQIPADVF
jgi:hypothetical protein